MDRTARYREIADDLRCRIISGEFPVGVQLPSIARMQGHYDVPGFNTIRQAQQVLVDEGLLEIRQGVGAFVLRSAAAAPPVDLLALLLEARAALEHAVAALEKAVSDPRAPTCDSCHGAVPGAELGTVTALPTRS